MSELSFDVGTILHVTSTVVQYDDVNMTWKWRAEKKTNNKDTPVTAGNKPVEEMKPENAPVETEFETEIVPGETDTGLGEKDGGIIPWIQP